MSRRRAGETSLAVAVVILLLGAAAVAWKLVEFGQGFGRALDESLGWSYAMSHRVEVPGEGLSLRIGEGWQAVAVEPDTRMDGDPPIRPVLRLDVGVEGASCLVQVADDAAPDFETSSGDQVDGEMLAAAAEPLLTQWREERGFAEDCSGTDGPSWGGKVGNSCAAQDGSTGVIWFVPVDDDLVTVSCSWADPGGWDQTHQSWRDPYMLLLATGALADSVESVGS